MVTHTFPSRSSATVYTATLDPATGATACDCAGWRFKRGEQARGCRHTRALEAAQTPAGKQATVDSAAEAAVARADATPLTYDRLHDELPMPMPKALNPMLASAMTDTVFADYENDAWTLEPKLDGHRCVVRKTATDVWAWSRPRAGAGKVGLARTLPVGIVDALKQMPDGVYDGELVTPSGKAWDVSRSETFADQTLVLFDVVELFGQALAAKPYGERRPALEMAVAHLQGTPHATRVGITPAVPVTWAAVEAVWAAGGEGAVLKRKAAPYRPGHRSADWIKVKRSLSLTMTVTGFEAAKLGPYSVVLLRGDDGVETKVKTLDNHWLREFAAAPGSFIGRRLVISCQERIAKGGQPRHPMWDHFAGEGE